MQRWLLLLGVVGLVSTVPTSFDEITPRDGESCGYDSCTDAEPGVLNVHLVSHTHDDVGWLKTLDQYYYGSRNTIQKACVECILNSVVKELWLDPKRKFIYVETAFFWKWWVAQPASVKSQVHTLVRQGRLQFVGGAWTMNDEAASHYQSTVDQFTWGLQKLNDTFGECGRPRVGWQIDPFGHSREFAANLASMGYDGLFLGRIDYQDKALRLKERTMEMLWRGSDELGKSSDIFTGVLYNMYQPPAGFCFDVLCDDEPIIDDVSSPMYNLDAKVATFLEVAANMSKAYRTNNILVTMGDDFRYLDASLQFNNIDKLIKYTNLKAIKENLNVKLFYSTPACYLKAVKDANPTLPIKQDDFLPYGSDSHAYWTGYYTSRPTTKWMEREANNYLQTFKILQSLTNLPESNMVILNELKSAVGMMQHHDAITGTEKQHVAHDYERIVSRAVDDAYAIGNQAFNKLLMPEASLVYERCEFNQSQCSVTERSQAFVVTIFNNQVMPKSTVKIFMPVTGDAYSVYDANGTSITCGTAKLPSELFSMPTRQSNATHYLYFYGKNLPGLGYENFYVKKETARDSDSKTVTSDDEDSRDIVLENDYIILSINKDSGRMNYTSRTDGTTLSLLAVPGYYSAFEGNNEIAANRSSGAYVFRPNMTSTPVLHTFQDFTVTNVVQSALMQEVHIHYDDSVSMTIGLKDYTLYFYTTLSIDSGREYVLRFQTDLKTDGAFYTDSNGRQMLKRIRNTRPQWNLTLAEPISGNYYPVVQEMYIEDVNKNLRVVVDVDRARGCASLEDGWLEVMQHRRLKRDDSFGVDEALNETVGGKGLYSIDSIMLQVVPKTKENLLTTAERSLRFFSRPQQFVAEAPFSLDKFKTMTNVYSFLKTDLPQGVHLLTLEPWNNKILIRFENYLDKELSPDYVSVDLTKVFNTIEIRSIKETTLAANIWFEDYKQWEWNTDEEFSESFNKEYGNEGVNRAKEGKKYDDDGMIIKLRAKEIRTFVAEYGVKN